MFALIFIALALVTAAIHIGLSKDRSMPKVIEILFVHLLVFYTGFVGIFAGLAQIYMPDNIAAQIGWANSPFLFEVAWANIGVGVACILAWFIKGNYRLGPVVMNTIFIFGAAYGHFVELAKGDHAAYNAGPFLYIGDILMPTIILVLAALYFLVVLPKSSQKQP